MNTVVNIVDLLCFTFLIGTVAITFKADFGPNSNRMKRIINVFLITTFYFPATMFFVFWVKGNDLVIKYFSFVLATVPAILMLNREMLNPNPIKKKIDMDLSEYP